MFKHKFMKRLGLLLALLNMSYFALLHAALCDVFEVVYYIIFGVGFYLTAGLNPMLVSLSSPMSFSVLPWDWEKAAVSVLSGTLCCGPTAGLLHTWCEASSLACLWTSLSSSSVPFLSKFLHQQGVSVTLSVCQAGPEPWGSMKIRVSPTEKTLPCSSFDLVISFNKGYDSLPQSQGNYMV